MDDSGSGNWLGRNPPILIDISSSPSDEIEKLYLHQNCFRCPLSQSRQTVVWGRGPTPAEILVVGQKPGKFEDIEGVPLIGSSADLLFQLWQEAGISQGDLYLTLLNKCYPHNGRITTVFERERCFPFLNRDISLVRPRIIVSLGGLVFKALTGITWRGGETDNPQVVGAQIRDTNTIWNSMIIATFHPAAWLRMLPGEEKNIMFQRMLADWRLVSGIVSNYSPELTSL